MKSLFDFQREYITGYYEQYQKYLRTHFAAMAMQGLLANSQFLNNVVNAGFDEDPGQYSFLAVRYADALVAELNKPIP